MNEAQKLAVAEFSKNFESAIIGLQLNNPAMPTVTASQYAAALAAGLYAGQRLVDLGQTLPPESVEANFQQYLESAAGHYVEQLTTVAEQQARELLDRVAPPDPS